MDSAYVGTRVGDMDGVSVNGQLPYSLSFRVSWYRRDSSGRSEISAAASAEDTRALSHQHV